MFMLGYAYQTGRVPLSAAAHRAGDRAQRRGGGDEPRRLHLGPPRRGRARSASTAMVERAEAPTDRASSPRRWTRSIARRVAFLTDYQNARLCASATAAASSACARPRAAPSPGSTALDRGGRALAVQADGLQGRVRGRAALHRRRISRSRSPQPFEGENLRLRVPPRAAAPRPQKDPATGLPRKMSFGPWMMKAFGLLAQLQGPARHAARRLRLHARSAASSAGSSATTRRCSRRSSAKLDAGNHALAIGLAAPAAEDPRLRPRQGAATSRRRRRRRRSCSPSSAPVRSRCRSRRSSRPAAEPSGLGIETWIPFPRLRRAGDDGGRSRF